MLPTGTSPLVRSRYVFISARCSCLHTSTSTASGLHNRHYTEEGNIGNLFKSNLFKLFPKQYGIHPTINITKGVPSLFILYIISGRHMTDILKTKAIRATVKNNHFQLFRKDVDICWIKNRKKFFKPYCLHFLYCNNRQICQTAMILIQMFLSSKS